MCGIVGVFGPAGSRDEDLAMIRRMLILMNHRGPDEQGIFIDERAILGNVRLSILDLANGQQPMADRSGRYWITYNGEVYNYREIRQELESLGHRFRTTSDTEVVVEAWSHWGTEAPTRFNGCYAFAVYDTYLSELFLARDPVGKRPVFYTNVAEDFVFGSEMKVFLAHPRIRFDFDEEQLASIFANWAPLPSETGYRGIHQLPMGTILCVRGHSRTLIPFAPLRLLEPETALTIEEATAHTRALLENSVQLRMRSDVPVGTYLSGGLDSSILTCLAAAGVGNLSSFSISFEEQAFDEAPEQREVQKALGVTHNTLHVSNADIAAHLPAALWHAEVPVFRTAFVPMYLLAREVSRQGIKVVLTGEGADEVFLGYDHFKETLIRSRWHELAGDEERRRLILRLYPYFAHYREDHLKALVAMYRQTSVNPDGDLFSLQLRHNMGALSHRTLERPSLDPHRPLRNLIETEHEVFAALDPVRKAQWLEFKTLLAGYLLSTQGDRMGMSHGVENRCPFLDPRVITWGSSLPLNWKLADDGTEKYILRRAFQHDLPPSILTRQKRPYRAPDVEVFLRGPRPDYLDTILSPKELAKVSAFAGPFCSRFLNKIIQPDHALHPRDSHTFMFILTTALLHRLFVRREGLVLPEPSVRAAVIDRRRRQAA